MANLTEALRLTVPALVNVQMYNYYIIISFCCESVGGHFVGDLLKKII